MPVKCIAISVAISQLQNRRKVKRTRSVSRARGQEGEKYNACTHTIVRAVPAFKYECGYPIGYFTSRDPRMFFKYNMAFASSCSVDEAIRETLRLFPNGPPSSLPFNLLTPA